MSSDARILVLAKQRPGLSEVAEYLRSREPSTEVIVGASGDPFPERVLRWSGDVLVSYIAPWIVPQAALDRPKVAAINFHPGPPEYPGIGCTNFALYEGAARFGVTAHHMRAAVDTGDIIAAPRFDVLPDDTVKSLTDRCYARLASCLREVFDEYFRTGRFPSSPERWTRRPFRRKELDALCRVTPDMPPAEVARRVRATTYPGMPGAFVELAGYRFEFKGDAA